MPRRARYSFFLFYYLVCNIIICYQQARRAMYRLLLPVGKSVVFGATINARSLNIRYWWMYVICREHINSQTLKTEQFVIDLITKFPLCHLFSVSFQVAFFLLFHIKIMLSLSLSLCAIVCVWGNASDIMQFTYRQHVRKMRIIKC